jgi:hypothetical protein
MLGDVARAAPAERSDPQTQRTQQTGLDSVMEFHRNAEGWKSVGKGRLVEQLASRPNFMDMLGPLENPKKTLGQMNRNQIVALLLKYDKAHGHLGLRLLLVGGNSDRVIPTGIRGLWTPLQNGTIPLAGEVPSFELWVRLDFCQ